MALPLGRRGRGRVTSLQVQLLVLGQRVHHVRQGLASHGPLGAGSGRHLHQSPPQNALAEVAPELHDAVLVVLDHGLEHHEVGLGHGRNRDVGDGRGGHPPVVVRERGGEPRLVEVAKGEGGEAGAEPDHALHVALLGDEVAALAQPAEALLARHRLLVAAGDAEEDGAGDVVLGEEDVDEGGVPVPLEVGQREDAGAQDAESVGGLRLDARLINKLGDQGFGEDVEEVDEEGWTMAVAKGGRGGEEVVDHIDLRGAVSKSILESVDDFVKLLAVSFSPRDSGKGASLLGFCSWRCRQ